VRVQWDKRLEALFGLAPGAFDGTFATYSSMLHPEDRDRVLGAVQEGMARGKPWRFDHRVVWADGSVHWIEGRGEPVYDDAGVVVGASGVSIGIDARRQAETERGELLEAERDARDAAERSSSALQRLSDLTLALSGAATVDQVAQTIVRYGVDALRADFGWFGTVDPGADTVVTRAHSGYPPEFIDPYIVLPLDATLPATDALRTGAPIFVETPQDRVSRYPQFADDAVHSAFVVAPITALEDSRGVVSFGFRGTRRFTDSDRRYIAAVIEACAQALRRAALFEAGQLSRMRLRTLLELSEALARLDDPEEVLRTTARFAARGIGRFATVYAIRTDGTLRRAAVAHADPEIEAVMADPAGEEDDVAEVVRKVAETGVGTIIEDVDEWMTEPEPSPGLQRLLTLLRPVSGLVVPMAISGRTRGVVVIGDDRPGPLGPTDFELASDVARRGASALERAQLWQASQRQLEVEHRMVQTLQQSIMPEQLPEAPGARLGAVYRPADISIDVGGDWYDAFMVDDGSLVLVVGDVAGHGIEAASLMGRARNALRAYAVEDADPATLLARVHTMLRALDPDAMITAVVARFDPKTRLLIWSRAGHPPPLLCSPDDCRFLDAVNATPLGTFGRNFEDAREMLEPNSLLVIYTDGLVERRDHLIDEGLQWLSDRVTALRHRDPQDVCAALAEGGFTGEPSNDDTCVLVLRITQ
jgi:PAS domain S-box-containing protein